MVALTRKDFQTENDVRWCPGCGDYVILATVQRIFAELGLTRENTVFVSGIGCAARFPYYMNTYGMHSIHGRAPAIATGLKVTRPDLSVWVITGDGDALSIGGNHTLHLLRRNVGVKVLLFNNQIYGLTKGQYSPTSQEGTLSKSTPYGSIDHPVSPLSFALGAGATFIARTTDSDPKHLGDTIKRAAEHKGTAFVEIFQNCVVFNDEVFSSVTAKEVRAQRQLLLEDGKPLLFDSGKKGIGLDPITFKPFLVDLEKDPSSIKQVAIHQEKDELGMLAHLYGQMRYPDYPVPMGVFRVVHRPCYEDLVKEQELEVIAQRGEGELQRLIEGGDTWEV